MGHRFKCLVCSLLLNSFYFDLVCTDSYNVIVDTEAYVNIVDSKFLSFTIDPKYLISSSEKYNSKECICMATSLTPAYIRIAGPSTARMTFKNTTIAIEDHQPRRLTLNQLYSDEDDSDHRMSQTKWEKFVHWAKRTGFDLVFALNHEEKTTSGMWDANTALRILTVADKANVGQMFWQLSYECKNQSIEEYLNDLETLRVIIETFPSGKDGKWQVVGGDVTNCLQPDSKSDFKDYVTLSNDMMDAILLNGNSSSRELQRMSEKDRYKLLKLLSTSDTPLWLTEHNHLTSELERAADWMTSLGYSARNGFSVHFRELKEKELYEPSLSFYMALLFKNLVGEQVLDVDIEASKAILFAHCTSLRHKPVPGAVSFYGANMDDEPARFSIKMAKKEQGGDIMQFILGHDRNGNIVVNGRAMYYEGDIRPVVKRVRPYKTLLINLPPKSFGFWVLANTQVNACFHTEMKIKQKPVDTSSGENDEENVIKTKRSLYRKTRDVDNLIDPEGIDEEKKDDLGENKKTFDEGIDQINKDLRETLSRIYRLNTNKTVFKRSTFQDLFKAKLRRTSTGRQIFEQNNAKHTRHKNSKRKLRHSVDNDSFKNRLISKISKISSDFPKFNDVISKRRNFKRNSRVQTKRNLNKQSPRKVIKHDVKNKAEESENSAMPSQNIEFRKETLLDDNNIRNRRSIDAKSKLKVEEDSSENEIEVDEKQSVKIEQILQKLRKLKDLPQELKEKDDKDYENEQESNERIVLKTNVLDDGAVFDISEKSNSGILKSTLQEILSLLADFNRNFNRFWAAVTMLE